VQLPSGSGDHHLTICRVARLSGRAPWERDTALATLAYFDQLNLAEGIGCPTLMASAIIDEVHPLRTVMPVFEKIPAMKSIIVYPDLEHEYRSDFTHHGKAWMDRYLR
jgi:cephalosporin-C deacetylase-like acetyl esterase